MKNNLETHVVHLDSCNQKCLFCMKSEDIARKREISFKDVRQEIIKGKRSGCKKIDFFGGEPTVFSFLKKAVAFAQSEGMFTTIATNGLKFSSAQYADNFFSGLKIDKLAVRISMHSYKPQVHDKITQIKGSHSKTVTGTKNILKYTKRVGLNVVVTSLNYKDLEKITRFIGDLGVVSIKFSMLNLTGRILKNKILLIEEEKVHPYLLKSIMLSKKSKFLFIGMEKFSEIFRHRYSKKFKFLEFLD